VVNAIGYYEKRLGRFLVVVMSLEEGKGIKALVQVKPSSLVTLVFG
jgi:hypothetical protein